MEKLDALCADACVGSLISLTSKSEIRYEGELFTLDTEKSTIVLKDVRSFGTEGRGTNNLHIPSSSMIYEYIIFRNTDIKDLSVVAFSGISKKPHEAVQEVVNSSEKVHDHFNGRSLDICLGWPVSPISSQIPDWWRWPRPFTTQESYGISPNSFLPTFENKTATLCSWRADQAASVLSSQAKLSILEQAPPVITRTQALVPSQDSSASKQGFTANHETCQSSASLQRDKPPFSSSQPCASLQQPLLPLPSSVSQSQHRRRLMREFKGFTSREHARKAKVRSRARPQTPTCEKESIPSTSNEVAHLLKFDISKEFDFAAMNEQFNKKEVWHEIELNNMEGVNTNQNPNDPSQTFLNSTYNLSRKAQFVDDFFDLSLSERQSRLKEPKSVKPSQIDAETFGVSSKPKKRHRLRRGALGGERHISIQTK